MGGKAKNYYLSLQLREISFRLTNLVKSFLKAEIFNNYLRALTSKNTTWILL